MTKPKKPLIEKNIEKFIRNNFDKKENRKDFTKKFEWFVNSMHIWNISSTIFNSNTKIGKTVELGDSRGSDSFFISINDYQQIFTLEDDIDNIVQYLKSHGESITFHFIQTKTSSSIESSAFLNLIDIPFTIWKGGSFDQNQPILNKIKDFIDEITDEDDNILSKIKHKLEISFYSNKSDSDLEILYKEWEQLINSKKESLSEWFSKDNIKINFRGFNFLNSSYENTISNDLELIVNKGNVIEADTKKYLIGYITAKQLLDCISYENEEGNNILKADVFANNIRLYLGRSSVNEKIELTLKNEPERFHFYNNGLTITTKLIEDNSKNFIIKSVNIVNGCQTANSIYNVSRSNSNDISKIKIPVKIIVAEDVEYEKITVRSNTQNGIDSKDLLSITSIQKELEESFKEINFHESIFFYKRQKSKDVMVESECDYLIQLDDILRATFSTVLLIPNKVSGYFDQTTAKYVETIFEERFVKLYTYLTAMLKIVENYIDENEPELKRLKYHILYIIYKKVNFGNNHKELEEFFRSNTILTEEEILEQEKLISNIINNIHPLLKNKETFRTEIIGIISVLKDKYNHLLNMKNKKEERELYKPVEKLYRTRTSPLFEHFENNFINNI